MDATAIAAFRGSPWADAAVRLRRWDDAAKVVGRAVPSIAEYRDVIRALVHRSP